MKSVFWLVCGMIMQSIMSTVSAASIVPKYSTIEYDAKMTKPVIAVQPIRAHSLSPLKPAAGAQYKLNWKHKLVLKYVLKKLRRAGQGDEPIDRKRLKQGRWALILGAGAFLLVFIPVLGVLAIPAAIMGVVLGIISVQDNNNLPGILGICFGGAFLLLLAIAVAVIIGIFAGFF